MNLRPYQINCCKDVRQSWEDVSKALAVLPTGAGKTIIAAGISKEVVDAGGKVLFMAHREELLLQTMDKFKRAVGLETELEKAEFSASLGAPVVVGSVQSMLRRLDKFPADHFDLVIVDEAHHTLSDSYLTTLRRFDGHANVLGVTATPDRGDKKNLGQYYEKTAFEVSLFELIAAGYLSRIALKAVPLKIDLSNVRSVAGDFNDADLGHALEPYLGKIAEAVRDHASFRRTLCFLPLIQTSKMFIEACNDVGLSAAHIDGTFDSAERRTTLDRFAAGEFDVLSNAMLLTEGYDDPGIDCVCVLRPTRSRPLYAQMVGRGTRIHETKENLLLLDFLWMHERHSIARPSNLIAKNQEQADSITAASTPEGGMPGEIAETLELDLEELAETAEHQRETQLREQLEKQKDKKAKTISAEEFALEHGSMELAEYEPTMQWESGPVSPKQETYLKRAKIDLSTVKGKGHASKLLSIYFGSKPLKLASPGQRSLMARMGHANPESATADEARKFFAALNKPKPVKEAMLL